MSKRTSAYRFSTQDRNDPRIAGLRAMISAENKMAQWVPTEKAIWDWRTRVYSSAERRIRHRVSVKGRLGKNNPNRHLITKSQVAYGSIPLDLAGYYDVYVHVVPEIRFPEPDPAPPITLEEFREAFRTEVHSVMERFLTDPKYFHLLNAQNAIDKELAMILHDRL